MLAGVFMAVFMVALLWHVIGLGQSIVYKQKLQDAADASAFGASALHARAMNLIGLTNLIQLSGFTTMMGLSHAIHLVGPEVCQQGAVYGHGHWTWCISAHQKLIGIRNQVRPSLLALVEQSTRAAEAIRDAVPQLAAERVSFLTNRVFRTSTAGVLISRPMPLRTDSYKTLCHKGYLFESALIERTLPPDVIHVVGHGYIRSPRVDLAEEQECTAEGGGGFGPQVMDPPNQSGTEPLQVRVVTLADVRRIDDLPVGLPSLVFGKQATVTGREWIKDRSQLAGLANMALAQAEYYSTWQYANTLQSHSNTTLPEENTFYMHWKARMRRVRVPVDVTPAQMRNSFGPWVRDALIPACEASCHNQPCAGWCSSLDYLSVLGGYSFH